MRERYRLQIRGDFFNILNHPNWGAGWWAPPAEPLGRSPRSHRRLRHQHPGCGAAILLSTSIDPLTSLAPVTDGG